MKKLIFAKLRRIFDRCRGNACHEEMACITIRGDLAWGRGSKRTGSYMELAAVHHLLPSFLNEVVTVDGQRGVVINVLGSQAVVVRLADGRERRLGFTRALDALFCTLKSANSSGTPEIVKIMAVSCLDNMREYKRQRALLNSATRATTRKRI